MKKCSWKHLWWILSCECSSVGAVLTPTVCRSGPLSWPQWLEWEEGQQVFSGREKRKERQSGDLSKHVGVYSDPFTHRCARSWGCQEAGVDSVSPPSRPPFLSLSLFCLSFFTLSHSVLSIVLFVFYSPLLSLFLSLLLLMLAIVRPPPI